jgi:hypothetical protein
MRCIPLTTSLSPKVYYRRKFKARKRNTSRANQDKVPIFGQSVIHNSALEVDQGGNISTHKRKPTPATVTKLRRSKRQAGRNDGYRPSSSGTRSKDRDKKKSTSLGNSVGKAHTFLIPQA